MNDKLIKLLRDICEDADDTGCEDAYVVSANHIEAGKEFLQDLDQTYTVKKVFSGNTQSEVQEEGMTLKGAQQMCSGPDTEGVLETGEKWMLCFFKE